ncbi:putative Autophagy-related protein 27 [Monocercomonoides exilis]|uniref:putative Autophagy-related protein 27 n=1 Tax=Monocercomonoides exilis TaxID=2049356 RepID=UPI003559D951|nr:putative Autophagy-related protein 27 [Monocercomonoides exilis]|eukprot:MONOS_2074.1-p1 / transcript=MONOS_2074.1 / gene=MONOS_2074 / organism=Monocercomonoides_exilis_PA203 / gene_product=unspecified product / transcript_product=unspecified product / location=Mono_scaffold00040:126340-127385(+) / protein_length=232 / sequence_SO=supercontig / SO=protein_coding / is_pseudo=false
MIFIFLQVFITYLTAQTLEDYNFEGLTRKTSEPRNVPANGYIVSFNFRTAVPKIATDVTCESSDCAMPVYEKDFEDDCACYGLATNETWTIKPNNEGIQFKYYSNLQTERYGYLDFLCSKEESISATEDFKVARVTWKHPQACQVIKPKNPEKEKTKLSFGSVMLIIFAASFLLYFAIGIPIMILAFKKRGLEMIPFVGFWRSLPGLVIDGVKFLLSPCLKSKSGYADISEK